MAWQRGGGLKTDGKWGGGQVPFLHTLEKSRTSPKVKVTLTAGD